MKNLGSKVAAGAAWMIGLRLLQRSLGLISTAVLARLLLPADFGLIAMAMSVTALVDLITMLGFDLALIRRQEAVRQHFDTAWTLGLIFKIASGLGMVAVAPLVAGFYSDPRLTDIIYIYALVAFISGFENIGIVAFRKELEFQREFRFQLAKKLLAVGGTIALAVYFKSYWALVLGTLFSQIVGVGLSYWMHSYRPRLCLTAWRDLLGFSAWVMFNNVVMYARDRGIDFITGRFLGAKPLGSYRVADEIATLPTTELYMPIMRAVFPGFSKLIGNKDALQSAYLNAQAAVIAVTLPAAIGVSLLAEPLVMVLLGSNWHSAVPLVEILSLYGATMILHGNRYSLFMAIGKPYWIGLMIIAELLVMYPLSIYWLMNGKGVEMVAWSKVASAVITLPFGVILVSKVLDFTTRQFLAIAWRPLVSVALMATVLTVLKVEFASVGGAASYLVQLLALTAIGFLVYLASTLALWRLSGAPEGAERYLLQMLAKRNIVPARFLRIFSLNK